MFSRYERTDVRGLNQIRTISLVTFRSVTTTEIFFYGPTSKYISQEPMRILKSTTDLLGYYGLLSAE